MVPSLWLRLHVRTLRAGLFHNPAQDYVAGVGPMQMQRTKSLPAHLQKKIGKLAQEHKKARRH